MTASFCESEKALPCAGQGPCERARPARLSCRDADRTGSQAFVAGAFVSAGLPAAFRRNRGRDWPLLPRLGFRRPFPPTPGSCVRPFEGLPRKPVLPHHRLIVCGNAAALIPIATPDMFEQGRKSRSKRAEALARFRRVRHYRSNGSAWLASSMSGSAHYAVGVVKRGAGFCSSCRGCPT